MKIPKPSSRAVACIPLLLCGMCGDAQAHVYMIVAAQNAMQRERPVYFFYLQHPVLTFCALWAVTLAVVYGAWYWKSAQTARKNLKWLVLALAAGMLLLQPVLWAMLTFLWRMF